MLYTVCQGFFFKDRALIFLNFYGEESSQPTNHAHKIIISLFLIMKAAILDTHGIFFKLLNGHKQNFVDVMLKAGAKADRYVLFSKFYQKC